LLRLRRRRVTRGAGRLAASAAAILPRVVGDVPAAALELDCRSGKELVDRAAALWTLVHRRIRKLLHDFEAVTVRVALVFVQRHYVPVDRCLENPPPAYSSMSPPSTPSINVRCSQNGAVPLPSSVS